jgi:outer membrane protein, heavy metal efflux system
MKRMLFVHRLWFLMTVTLAGSLALSAQEFQPRPASDFLDLQQGVTQEELVTRALASNPTLLAQRQQIAMAKGDLEQARLRQNPSLTLGGLKEINGGDNAISVSGSLPLELFGRRARRTQVAESKEDATQQSVADKERLLSAEVCTLYGQALASIRDLMFVEQLLQVNRDFLRLMEDRTREGATPSLNADETRVEVNRIETLRIDYQAKAEVALLALKEIVGVDPDEAIRLKGVLELAHQDYDQNQLLQLAIEHRPDLAFQRANEVLANAELHFDRATGKPDASVYVGYERPDSGFSQRAFDASGNLSPIRQTFNHVVFGLNIIFSSDLADAETTYLAMSAALEADHKKLQRTGNLVKLGAASQQEEDDVTAEHAMHEAHVRAALEKLQLLGASDRQIAALTQAGQIDANFSVPAPISGIVLTRAANLGLVTNMSQELFTVADLSTVWVMASINEKDFSTIHVGQPQQ